MIIFGTGHRPKDISQTFDELVAICEEALTKYQDNRMAVICGMADGFDQAIGKATMNLGLELWCARPWAGHVAGDRKLYVELMNYSHEIEVLHAEQVYPGPQAYFDRNHWMVDNADEGLAFWNGGHKGGTFECITYANKVGKPFTNLYRD